MFTNKHLKPKVNTIYRFLVYGPENMDMLLIHAELVYTLTLIIESYESAYEAKRKFDYTAVNQFIHRFKPPRNLFKHK